MYKMNEVSRYIAWRENRDAQCFEFGAVNWQKKRGIFVTKRITITYILYINLL